ncbi:hypothetical protein [Enterobacter oligotrophicus]|uniref:hypothetical protein n=1 Tax=Enterobacter oligotrophicus TaxID=2478464 RepID=UPI0004B1FB31|nr:hypothetical protein [Enterobacter oligotrophicus]
MLADRWGEPDPRKLAALPASILTAWEAYFSLLERKRENPEQLTQPGREPVQQYDADFADCERLLGHG